MNDFHLLNLADATISERRAEADRQQALRNELNRQRRNLPGQGTEQGDAAAEAQGTLAHDRGAVMRPILRPFGSSVGLCITRSKLKVQGVSSQEQAAWSAVGSGPVQVPGSSTEVWYTTPHSRPTWFSKAWTSIPW